MNNPEQEYTQALGLDIGTSRIVVARNGDKKCQYDSELNAFLTIPYSKLAESLLVRENVFHEVQGSDIVVAGNEPRFFIWKPAGRWRTAYSILMNLTVWR